MNVKFKSVKNNYEDDYEKLVFIKNLNNQESSREQSNVLNARFRSETLKSHLNNQDSNNREISQVFEFD